MSYQVTITKQFLDLANKDKDALNALALAVCIKTKFLSSAVHNYDIKSLKSLFQSSSKTISSAIKKGKELGFIRVDNNGMVACNISTKIGTGYYYKNNDIIIKLNGSIKITIKNIKKELTKKSVIKYIEVRNLVCSEKAKALNPSSLKELKNAKNKIKKWGIDKFDTSDGISYSSIANSINKSTRHTIKVVSELVKEGILNKTVNRREIVTSLQKHSEVFLGNYCFSYKKMILIQKPNIYSFSNTHLLVP